MVTGGGNSPAEVKKTLGDGKFVEDDLTDADLRHIKEDGAVDETMMALKPEKARTGKGEVIWLEKGDSATGWEHILQRHENDFYKATSVSDQQGIKNTIYDTIKNGDPKAIPKEDGGGTIYKSVVGPQKAIRVVVSDKGYVISAYPVDI